MVVFSLFFRRAAGDPSSPVPYPLFVLAGLVPWMFFANAIGQASMSVVGDYKLVTKVYFPRLIIPLGAVGAALVDLGIALGMLLVMAALVWDRARAVVLAGATLIVRPGDRRAGGRDAAGGADRRLSGFPAPHTVPVATLALRHAEHLLAGGLRSGYDPGTPVTVESSLWVDRWFPRGTPGGGPSTVTRSPSPES